MKNIYIVYHKVDFDGVCSAAIVYWTLKEHNNNYNINLVPINHGEVFDLWDKVDTNDDVYMVDFSLPIEELILLNDITNLILIDHHKTAIDSIEESGVKFNGCQSIGIGACYLTYKFMYRALHNINNNRRIHIWERIKRKMRICGGPISQELDLQAE